MASIMTLFFSTLSCTQYLLRHLDCKPLMATPVIFLQMNNFPSLALNSLDIYL